MTGTLAIVRKPRADAARNRAGFLLASGCAVVGRRNSQVVEQAAEQLAVFGEIDVRRIGADDGDAETLQGQREIERRLAAELNDQAIGLLGIDDVEDVLKRQRLEVPAQYMGFAGTVAQVADLVGEFKDAGSQLLIANAWRNDAETLELLAADVMPKFAG